MVILFLGWQGSRTRLPYHWALPDRTPSLGWVWKLARLEKRCMSLRE